MKHIINIFIALFCIANLISAQDTLYVYKAGAVYSKCAISEIDSVTFSKIYPISGSVSDNDGHTYKYKQIGSQVWMTENLRTSKYRNGESISNPTVDADWLATTVGAWCNYNNDATTYDSKYGKLYNWYALNDSRNIAPTGWHVATDADWTNLTNYVEANLGTSISLGKALASTTDWLPDFNAGAIGNNLSLNNYSGFSALPGGARSTKLNGAFVAIGNDCYFNSISTQDISTYVLGRSLFYRYDGAYISYGDKSSGCSVRCVRDAQ